MSYHSYVRFRSLGILGLTQLAVEAWRKKPVWDNLGPGGIAKARETLDRDEDDAPVRKVQPESRDETLTRGFLVLASTSQAWDRTGPVEPALMTAIT